MDKIQESVFFGQLFGLMDTLHCITASLLSLQMAVKPFSKLSRSLRTPDRSTLAGQVSQQPLVSALIPALSAPTPAQAHIRNEEDAEPNQTRPMTR